jgi:predicted  nucleic acid-binding Zn-ribbon protein
MEPLTAGAIALAYLLLNKTFEKTGEIIVAKGFEQGGKVIELLKRKSPETAGELEAAAEHAALPPGQPEYIGEAVLVEKIESAAKADPEIRAAVEALANDVDAAAKVNPELEKAINDLAETVKAQKITNIAKNNTGNVAVGGSVSIQAESFTQNFN